MNMHESWSSKKPEDFYVCQISDPAKVEDWIANIDSLDPKTPELHWCAMCCVRSLLLAEGLPSPLVQELFDMACQQGVYRPDPNIGWRGAYHRELADFINVVRIVDQRKASASRGMKISATSDDRWFNMEGLVRTGCYILLSVHPNIRLRMNTPQPNKRGHFVLVYGFIERDGQKYFLINNSTGFQSENSQIGMEISAERLEQVSCGDGIVVKSRFSRLIGE